MHCISWFAELSQIFPLLSCQPRVTVTSCFVYKVIRVLWSIDHLCINPILRIGLIHKWSIDSYQLKWSVHASVLLSNCKQSITSLSLLVGTTVQWHTPVWINDKQELLQPDTIKSLALWSPPNLGIFVIFHTNSLKCDIWSAFNTFETPSNVYLDLASVGLA